MSWTSWPKLRGPWRFGKWALMGRPGVPESLHSPTQLPSFHSSYSYLRVLAKAGTQATWPLPQLSFFSAQGVKVTPYPLTSPDVPFPQASSSCCCGPVHVPLGPGQIPLCTLLAQKTCHQKCRKHFCPQVTPVHILVAQRQAGSACRRLS